MDQFRTQVRRWECVCSGDLTRPCPVHAIVNQLEVLQLSHGGELSGSSPLFPTLVDRRHVVASIEFVANLTGGGVRRFGGHSLRVTGGHQYCAHPADGEVVIRRSSAIRC